jgi:hypothetical protein
MTTFLFIVASHLGSFLKVGMAFMGSTQGNEGDLSIQDWWSSLAEGPGHHRKGIASLVLLAVWKIWKEQNARVFRNKLSPTFVILDKIKCEARLWVITGAKRLGDLMSGE